MMTSSTKKTKILLANDDGIDAPGIQALFRELRPHYDVLVVAPMHEQSGKGCSLSLSNEMEVDERKENGVTWGYAVDGTPADCVKFAMTALKDYNPDLCLSGINRGMNIGNSVFYSGTVAAAIEATLYGLPAMATSLACIGHDVSYYEDSAVVIRKLLPWVLKLERQPRTLWNLNFPNVPAAKMKPLRFTSHGTSFFEDVFALSRREGERLFYKNVGHRLVECARNPDSDDRALTAGHISLSLLRTDLTIPAPHPAAVALEKDLQELIR